MQHYSHDDSFEREPLEPSSRVHYESPRRSARGGSYREDYYSPGSSGAYNDVSPHPPIQTSYRRSRDQGHEQARSGPYGAYQHEGAPAPPRHGDNSWARSQSDESMGDTAAGGMAGIAYGVAERNARESGLDAVHGSGQVPPPPSRTARAANSPYGLNPYDDPYAPGAHSNSSVRNPYSDQYGDDPYQSYSSSIRTGGDGLGVVNPNEIEDDGDDALHDVGRGSHRTSMLSSSNSDRGHRRGAGIGAGAGAGAATGGLMGGYLRNRDGSGNDFDLTTGQEKSKDWRAEKEAKKKRWRWAIIILVVFLIAGGVIGGIVGGLVVNGKNGGKKGSGDKGKSAEDDLNENGDLDIDSDEIKDLMNNSKLHKVFPGMDYTPIHTQYPWCLDDPPSQNNVTRDIAVLSQLTNKVRTYGTDCNQTEMVIHAINQLELQDDVKIWMGVWQDDNKTTNARQLEQMWSVLDKYGDKPFEGIIVANEILFREEMTIQTLGDLLDEVRTNLSDRTLDLPVATSDLGDDWSVALGKSSDYLMSNIHPFFAGTPADKAAAWTINFFKEFNGDMFKSDDKKNIISETGWPTGGGTNCGEAKTCTDGAVASVDGLNTFLNDWVCQALANGTNYFWFSAFDEPWKESFNEKGKEWEDKWGLMDVNRNLKDGVEIPDCDGKTVS
ncbi:hypothetical protein N3K66_007280 [Trichothecium roseum]|uniref:Uncharacterized protein n=1 Tax=Trichothecium roseum TaxID=47278 RepID=A0ACC0UTG3_9HYPO|nr:hypothetical protein N3K66_007280 [Trichothecium roseum]